MGLSSRLLGGRLGAARVCSCSSELGMGGYRGICPRIYPVLVRTGTGEYSHEYAHYFYVGGQEICQRICPGARRAIIFLLLVHRKKGKYTNEYAQGPGAPMPTHMPTHMPSKANIRQIIYVMIGNNVHITK